MIFVSSCPARPTNGMPWTSSSAPGASPTNIRSASGLPTPNTTCFRPSVVQLAARAVADLVANRRERLAAHELRRSPASAIARG